MKTPKELIDEMVAAGLRQQDIVDQAGVSKAFVSELRSGVSKTPRYPLMARLVELHKKVMRRQARKTRRSETV